jgi:hypothetical protein
MKKTLLKGFCVLAIGAGGGLMGCNSNAPKEEAPAAFTSPTEPVATPVVEATPEPTPEPTKAKSGKKKAAKKSPSKSSTK